LSRERLRQIEKRLKEKLQIFLKEELGLGADGEVLVLEQDSSEEQEATERVAKQK